MFTSYGVVPAHLGQGGRQRLAYANEISLMYVGILKGARPACVRIIRIVRQSSTQKS